MKAVNDIWTRLEKINSRRFVGTMLLARFWRSGGGAGGWGGEEKKLSEKDVLKKVWGPYKK